MNQRKHWLVRPKSIRMLWVAGGVILALTVVAEAFIETHPRFALSGVFGFNAWYGLSACVAMILISKVFGIMVKRSDSYYDQSDGDQES
jgi:hypothetical protein